MKKYKHRLKYLASFRRKKIILFEKIGFNLSKSSKKAVMASINHDPMGGLGENVSRKQIKVDSSRQTNINKIRQRKAKVSL
jgi:hypothetical protein